MNPQWITVGLVTAGLAGQGLWTVINLRIENRLLDRIDQLKDWADARFERRRFPVVAPPPAFASQRLSVSRAAGSGPDAV